MLAFEGVTTVSEGNKAREVGSLTSCEVRLIIYRLVADVELVPSQEEFTG